VSARVLGVLAGDLANADLVRLWAESADVVLAADGGADHLVAAGIRPDATVGDLDSISDRGRDASRLLIGVEDQDHSDCDKLLQFAEESGFSSITLVAATGRRVDHMLGALFSAARSRMNVSIAYDCLYARILRGPVKREIEARGMFSLIPLTPCEDVCLDGVSWPLLDARLEPQGLISLSNKALGHVRIEIGSGSGVAFVEFDGKPVWDGGSD
jgi:thiamine pyrophosphokinase